MKKRILSLALLVALSFPIMAQTDGFFSSKYSQYEKEYREDGYIHIFSENNADFLKMKGADDYAPIGNGLLVLSCAGLIYAFSKRKENEI